MSLFKRSINKFGHILESGKKKKISKKNLSLMKSSNHELIKKLASVLEAVLLYKFTNDETEWFSKVESLRSNLLSSTEVVPIVDYGPGHKGTSRSDEEMNKGVVGQSSVGEMCRKVSSPSVYCRLLFKIVHDFKVQRGIELGTALGISCSYQSAGMALNNAGQFVTCEGSPAVAAIADKNLKSLGLNRTRVVQGRFHDTYEDVLTSQKPVDYTFIDGHHDEFATVNYFEQLIPHLAQNAIVVFDDIDWSDGMKRAWKKITTMKGIIATVTLKNLGIVITERDFTSSPSHYEFFLK